MWLAQSVLEHINEKRRSFNTESPVCKLLKNHGRHKKKLFHFILNLEENIMVKSLFQHLQ